MKRAILASLTGMVGLSVLAMSCASGDPSVVEEAEGVGSVSEELSKCLGGKIGDSNYCNATCKCNLGEGDCDSVNECNVDPTYGQLFCTGQTTFFGHARAGNACAPQHCNNKKLDAAQGEVVVDCGGPCGNTCPGACSNLPANGMTGHCTTTCPCPAGEGDCDNNNAECQMGNFCAVNAGPSFGLAASVDVCLSNTCTNGMQDPGEDGLDCGPTCLPCSGGSTLSFAKGGPGADHGMDVAIDSSAAIVLAGRFGGTTSFGGPALTASGGSDIYVARYNNVGAHSWSKRFGGSAADGDLNVSVAVDNARNIYLAGNYRGTIDFGGGLTHTALGNSDAFIVKLNSSGVAQWSRSYGSVSAVRINGLAVSPAGDVFMAGAFASPSLNLGGAALTNQGAQGTNDGFVARLTTAGAHVWSRSFGSTGADQALNIAIDAALTPYVACSFQGAVEGMSSNMGSADACAMQLVAGSGTTSWAMPIGGSAADLGSAIEVDGLGPVLGGQFKSTVDFGDGMAVTALGSTGAFVVAFTTAGGFRWKKAYTSVGSDRTLAMAGTSAGVAALGDFQGSVDFGNGAVAATGTRDFFAVRFDTAGTLLWSATYGGNPTISPLGAATAGGMLGVTGDFQGSINFGSGAVSGGGNDDLFFTRFVF